VNYNGPKVGILGRARGLPLFGEIQRVQLAICWKLRVSGATTSVVTTRPVRTISRKDSFPTETRILRGHTPATQEWVKRWSEPHGDMRITRAKFLVG
jgi:hypothetical protein